MIYKNLDIFTNHDSKEKNLEKKNKNETLSIGQKKIMKFLKEKSKIEVDIGVFLIFRSKSIIPLTKRSSGSRERRSSR